MRENQRFWVVITCLALGFVGLIWRMVDLMVVDRAFLQGQGNARSIRQVSIPAYRGMITDRNGQPLAVSTPVVSIWVNPKEFDPATDTTNLAKILNIDATDIKKLVAHDAKREFVYLRRGLNPFVGTQVKNLSIPGVYVQNEFHRFYPEGEVTAQLVGLTNIDDQGQEGEELGNNHLLTGVPGKERILQDRMGHIVADLGLVQAPKPGHTITLSIDRRIQYLAYVELNQAVKDNNAQSGSVVVMDARTGEVLAMVNQPSYNPNSRPSLHDGRFKNRAVTDIFEPGSTNKAFSVANAFQSGHFQPDSIIDTEPGVLMVEGKPVKDDGHDFGVITATQVLQHSSNIGVTKMTLQTEPNSLWQLLHNVGYGQTTHSGFPGESVGVLQKRKTWRPFALATLSFGYGLSITNLQLAQAYVTLAAHGIKHPASLLRLDTVSAGERIIPEKIADEIVTMMRSVVEGGTGTSANVPGYTVAGKTGTARMVGANGYEKNHHVALFVGMAPATRPRLVVSVVITDPQGKVYHGGQVSAPVFAKVMAGALRIYDVPPDDLTTRNQSNSK